MECWYDSLFECDCAGIYELHKVPCAGGMGWTACYRQPWGGIVPMPDPLDPKLAKRIKWITSCAGVSSFYMIIHDDWKTKKWRIFIEVMSVREYYVKEGVTLWRSRPLDPHSCYYLGQYSWWWNFGYSRPMDPFGNMTLPLFTEAVKKRLGSPGFMPPSTFKYSPTFTVFGVTVGGSAYVPVTNVQPFPMAPFYPGKDWDLYKDREEEENRYFLGDHIIETWDEQTAVINYINNRFKNCIAQKYPPPGWKPKVKVKTPEAEFEWPGKSIKDLNPPIPMGPRAKPPGIEQTTVNASVALSFSPAESEDGLTLDVEIT